MLKDLMTPIERAKAMASGKEADRLPCNPNIAAGTARIYGCKISEFNHNGKAIADAQIAAYRKYGFDGVRVFTDLYVWAEAMGAKVMYPEDNIVELIGPSIEDISDIDKIKPANPYRDGRLPVHVEAMKYLIEELGSEVGCSGGIVGPFTNAAFLVGIEKFSKLMIKNPEAVERLCEISLQTCIAYADAVMSLGLTPTVSEPLSSCTIVSPKFFRKYSMPTLKRLIQHIKGKGKFTTLHICGYTEKIWDDIGELCEDGVAGFSIDNVEDLEKCKEALGSKLRIIGNVDPSNIMFAGTPKDVRQDVIRSVLQGFDAPKGYTLMSGCSLPVETPFENIQSMMDTAREIGYPVSREKLEKMSRE